jgi:S1-C subfamily serine protease
MVNVSIIIILMVMDVLSIVFPFYECFGLQGNNFVAHHRTGSSDPIVQIKTAITTSKGPLYLLNLTTPTEIFPQLFNKVKNSVVQINTKTSIVNPQVTINGSPQILEKLPGTGSGFVYDRDGDIVTNYHVINEVDNKSIYVTFLDGNSYPATIRGKDVHSDLAVLQIDSSAISRGEPMQNLTLANSSAIQIGQPVIAIGSPAGLTGSMTWGIISQTSRVQQDPTGNFWVGNLLQTDAPTTHGSSGGPLLNLNGEVIGITESGVASTEGPSVLSEPAITIAVSSNTVKKVVDDLIKYGTYKQPWIGVNVFDINPTIAQVMGLREALGVGIWNVTQGGPAYLAGIRPTANDTYAILKVDGNLVRKKSDLVNYIDNKKPGDSVDLQIRTNNYGFIKEFNVKLGQMPEEAVIPLSLPHRFGLLGPVMPPTLGVTGLALSPFQDNSTLSTCSHVAGTTDSIC